MLQNIQLHLHLDEDRQRAIEESVAPRLARLEQDNLNAFRQAIPSVLMQLGEQSDSSSSIMCNKNGELNIVDYSTGRVLYGFDPGQEVSSQVDLFARHPLTVSLHESDVEPGVNDSHYLTGLESPLAEQLRQAPPLSASLNVLVVLGIGLGGHIRHLLERFDIQHLIVYEPNLDYFKCSLLANDWAGCLALAERKQTAMYLQLGKDGRDLATDMSELAQHVPVEHFCLYQHYHHRVFDQISQTLAAGSWTDFRRWVVQTDPDARIENYLPPWTVPTEPSDWNRDNLNQQRFESNLAVFARFFPAVHKEFCDYQPDLWQPLADKQGRVNVFHRQSLTNLHGANPVEEGRQLFDGFAARPNKDSLVLGYRGKKLKRYLHYQFVSKAQDVLDNLEETQGSLPENIKSMLLFGLGCGYQLEAMVSQHQVDKLFICEPNRDFFYASLFAIDWQAIIERMDQSGGRLYLNIGDDGSHLIEDLLIQFHSIGPHVLASTYFFQGYYNSRLNQAIAQLREQLRVIIAMGDFFDHSRYGIAHTRWALEQGIPLLRKDARQHLSLEEKDVPVLMVGNGPSLDGLLPLIKENAEQVILVSCGTALQVLHRHGITPDFHAEIEINRATFDWAMRVGDLDYLKNIRLISCNGIHPDTCALYKETLLAFKEGESATVCNTEMYPKHNFAVLGQSYPTVSNFVANFITELGFHQIYLCGVDMGFVSNKYHHSKSSGYYDDSGEERYNYAETNDTSIVVPGNFRPYVNTKYEFKVSKTILEQVFGRTSAEVYNLNDGARIRGAQPLDPEHVLIVSSQEQKQQCLQSLVEKCFESVDIADYEHRFSERYSQRELNNELATYSGLISEEVLTFAEAEALVEKQREFLVASYWRKKSLAFYYLNGSINYVNGALSKILQIADVDKCLVEFNRILAYWRMAFSDIAQSLSSSPLEYDTTTSFVEQRRAIRLKPVVESRGIHFDMVPDEQSHLVNLLPWHLSQSENPAPAVQERFTLRFVETQEEALRILADSQTMVGTCLMIREAEVLKSLYRKCQCPVVYLPGNYLNEKDSAACNDLNRIKAAILAVLNGYSKCLILPKLALDKDVQSVSDYYDISNFSEKYAYDGLTHILLMDKKLPPEMELTVLDDRLRLLTKLKQEDLIASERSMAEQSKIKQNLRSLLLETE